MAPIDAAERARLLAALATQQASQREQHVTELANLHTRLRAARTELACCPAPNCGPWACRRPTPVAAPGTAS